jgi:hypothetical protein
MIQHYTYDGLGLDISAIAQTPTTPYDCLITKMMVNRDISRQQAEQNLAATDSMAIIKKGLGVFPESIKDVFNGALAKGKDFIIAIGPPGLSAADAQLVVDTIKTIATEARCVGAGLAEWQGKVAAARTRAYELPIDFAYKVGSRMTRPPGEEPLFFKIAQSVAPTGPVPETVPAPVVGAPARKIGATTLAIAAAAGAALLLLR